MISRIKRIPGLLDKKLWPVAIVLLVALVAAPVLIGKSSKGTPIAEAPPVGDSSPATPTSRAAVTLDTSSESSQDRPGSSRNLFKGPKLPKPKATTPASQTTTPPTTPASGGTSPSGGSTTPSTPSTPSTPTTPSTPDTKPGPPKASDPLDTYHLTVRFGRTDQPPLKTIKDIARLSPLPNAASPFMVYTGVLKDGKTAVLLLSSDATGTGDGHCKPTPKDCETVEVQQGNTEFFDLTVNGEPIQYQLDVVRLVKTQGASVQASEAAVRRHSQAGAAVLRAAHVHGGVRFAGASAYRWLPDEGVLVRTPHKPKAHASTDGAAPSAGPVVLPGQPVWHWKLGS